MKSRLIKLLKSFSREELKSFATFVESPLFIEKKNTFELFNYLVKQYPDFNPEKLKKEKLRNLFEVKENKNYHTGKNRKKSIEEQRDKKLETLTQYLLKLAEHFLAYRTFNEDESEFFLTVSRGYLQKNLPGESNRTNQSIEKTLSPMSSDYISKLKRLRDLKLEYHKGKNHLENVLKSNVNIFEASIIQFITDYTQYVNNSTVLKHNYEKNSENNFIHDTLKIINFDGLLERFEKDNYIKKPGIGLNYFTLKTLVDPDNLEYYYLLKNLLFKNLSKLDRKNKFFFFSHLVNSCNPKWENNVPGFDIEILNVLKRMFRSNSHTAVPEQNVDLMTYRTMVLSSYSQNDYKWLNHFIKKYLICLHEDHRDNIKQYSYAYLYYLKNEFEKSLNHISTFKNNEFHIFKLDVKQLSLKNYFELDLYDQTMSAIDAYKHFIVSNKKIPESSKGHYKNFINFYETLYKIKNKKSKKVPLVIKERIENCQKVVSKKWLLERADKIIKTIELKEKKNKNQKLSSGST